MRRIIIVAILATQIITACGQSNNPATASENTVTHDTTWYANRLMEVLYQAKGLMPEYDTLRLIDNRTPEQEARFRQIRAEGDSLVEKVAVGLIIEIAQKFKDTKFPAKYLDGDFPYYLTYDQLKAICDPTAAYYNEPELTRAKEMLASVEKRHPGMQYKNLTMQDMEGKTVKLSDYVGKGKYVLVDFWASWCGPCRMEMPNVVEAYAKFKDKGLEIVGVSFDQKKDAWTAAVKQLGMTWPQMSDLKGWQCEAHDVYGVNSIPSNVLIDPQGKIIATDLRGAELISFLTQALPKGEGV